MLKKKISFPPEHKKRLHQGAFIWLILALIVFFWAWEKAPETTTLMETLTPQASTIIKTVYITPQIEDRHHFSFPQNGFDTDKTAHIGLIMSGLGLSITRSARAVEDLPPVIALAFNPYGTLEQWVPEAIEAGHEALTLLPMEPRRYPIDDPGPDALLTRMTKEENIKTLTNILRRSAGAIGVMNYMGDAFLKDQEKLSDIFPVLADTGGIFVERQQATETLAEQVAKNTALPFIRSDLDIDKEATEAAIGQQLIALEQIAREKGYALGVMDPYPVSFNVIKAWMETLESKNIKLVTLSQLMKIKTYQENIEHAGQ